MFFDMTGPAAFSDILELELSLYDSIQGDIEEPLVQVPE
jgi:hypothetical protein